MVSQQSWADWLLDSYASSVSPIISESPYRHHDDSHSISDNSYSTSPTNPNSLSPMSSVSNSSAYGPYVRTGRGGAGNFIWQTELKPARSADLDLEAQAAKSSSLAERRKATARLESIDTKPAMRLRQQSAHHLSVGRGGAGNYASGAEIAQAKRSPSLPLSFSSSRPVSPPSAGAIHAGRGGAGNYEAAAAIGGRIESQKELEERLAAEQRREQIAVEVDGLLQPPPEAFLGGRRKSEAEFECV
ncbi:hypothetical protein EDD37DRAFT_103908 [Exophiala viscosa]|uniref:Uncharacterized protein n=1 Tax=Exophiala viscosa TaxID=2486360 RepID=A0AAN6IGC1_9EURO|nr:hypothetical protein EDD36DRAFT_121088 [Exophiala viscosa]KAI1630425.1 hypothetical protein EDD37DRAFT_103908 [Exophiala viscosa]